MKKFEKFYFEKFDFDKEKLKAKFYYSFDKQEFFEEIIDFSSVFFEIKNFDEFLLNNLLFSLHIALWISYYKLYPTEILVVKSWFLDDYQIRFWKKFYTNWLWEFLIKNNINFEKLINFENSKNIKNKNIKFVKNVLEEKKIIKNRKSLLMWGWWKDSIVSSILLEEEKTDFDTFVFWKIDKVKQESLDVLWKKTLLVKRKLSDNLFILNEKWYYNWHVPITWIIAFVSIVSAYLYWFDDIILSNEKSTSEENTVWKWLKINHQYSKSLEFENDFWDYLEKYLTKNIKYFSKLRKFYEYKIAEIFSKKAKKYFKVFSSCNKNFKINWKIQEKKWCCNCEKCSFVYLILSWFLDENELLDIFWKNLFENKKLLKTFEELIWLSNIKPFECVWTYDESFLSIYKVLEKYNNKIKSWEIEKKPYILEVLEEKILEKSKSINLKKIEEKLTNIY